jgi:hypothetical protein
MAEHSSLPWKRAIEAYRDWQTESHVCRVMDSSGNWCVAECFAADKEPAESNAEFIVRAVNSHDELVAALKEMHEMVLEAGFCDYSDGCGCKSSMLIKRAGEALLKAEGK